MKIGSWLAGIVVVALGVFAAASAVADETPKQGGTLTYLIPTDAPPSFDGQREWTFATAHTATPFYSLLIEVNPENLSSTTDFVCDLCTEMPEPTDNGTTYTFKIRQGVKFHDGAVLTAADVAASWDKIVFPPPGVISTRQSNYSMIDRIEAPDTSTVVFHLKFPTTAFLPALADPMSWIYEKAILEKDPHWYERNIDGTGPFKFAGYEAGQFIKGVRNPDYYRPGLPYLDGFTGIYADKQAVRVDALRADRAAIEFRGLPPSVRDELKQSLGDQLAVQESDWNCSNLITPNHARKPFDDVRVRRALTLALDRWHGAPGLAKIAVMRTVGGGVFPGGYREIPGGSATPIEGSRCREPQVRAPQPYSGPALQISGRVARRRMEQDRAANHPAGRADRSVDRIDAHGEFRRDDRGRLRRFGQPVGRHQQIPAVFGEPRKLWQLRRSDRGRAV
jgi:peptide/nickel transport system substrate-binding protein